MAEFYRNSYILDPDLAIKEIVYEADPEADLLLYRREFRTVQDTIDFFVGKNQYFPDGLDINNINVSNYYNEIPKLVLKEYFTNVFPVIDLMRFNQPIEYNPDHAYYTITRVIDSEQYSILPSLNKQFYIQQSTIYKPRYKVNDLYGELTIPPRGFYNQPVLESIERIISVRGQNSKIFKDSIRMLIRLRDGSLLELFDINFSTKNGNSYLNSIYKTLELLIQNDPYLAKRYILAFCLDVSQGRPAYSIDRIMQKAQL